MSSQVFARVRVLFSVVLSTTCLILLLFALPITDAGFTSIEPASKLEPAQAQTAYPSSPSFHPRPAFDAESDQIQSVTALFDIAPGLAERSRAQSQPGPIAPASDGPLTWDLTWHPEPLWTTSVAWGDVDGAGDLDLLVGNSLAPNQLYRNHGGTLTLDAAWKPLEAEKPTPPKKASTTEKSGKKTVTRAKKTTA